MLRRFFKSNQRIIVGTRTTLLVALVVFTAWLSIVTVTGFDITQTAVQSVDPEDPSTWYRTPFFIVESGSMMHPDAKFGRLGTIDPGDVVIIERVENVEDVSTFYGPGDEKNAGARGDVLVFIPAPTRENPFPQPVVHRAVAYLERDFIQIPNPNPGPGSATTVSVPRFTVEEFGIYDARAVNIPELGLYNYQPDRSGFLTRGDNPRTNDLSDQALGVTVHPVEMDRVLGRVTHTVPYVGLARIGLMGQDQSQLSPDHQWCSFLAGQAPCDNWVIFLALLYVFVGVPFLITLAVFSGRYSSRWRERRHFMRAQKEAIARYEAQQKEQGSGGPEDPLTVEVHDALDLLAGRLVPTGLKVAPRKQEWVRMQGGLHLHEGGPPRRDPPPQID